MVIGCNNGQDWVLRFQATVGLTQEGVCSLVFICFYVSPRFRGARVNFVTSIVVLAQAFIER